MIAFCQLQEQTWDAIAFSLAQHSPPPLLPAQSGGQQPVAAAAAPAAGAGAAAGRRWEVPEAMRRRLMGVGQIVVFLLIANAGRPLWIAAGIYSVLVLLGVVDAMRAAAAAAGRGAGRRATLENVLGRLKMRKKVEERIREQKRRLASGAALDEKEFEQMDKDEEFLEKHAKTRTGRGFRVLYQTLVMFFLTACPGATFDEELLK